MVGGMNEAVIKGYMIAAMESAGFEKKEIRKAILRLRSVMSEKTAEEAERKYLEEW